MNRTLIENNKLTVFLLQDIKENNPLIYYQFISATEEEVTNVMNQSNVIRNTYNQCVIEAKDAQNKDIYQLITKKE